MIKLIEKKPYTAPMLIELDAETTSELEKELDTHYTPLDIGSGLYLLFKANEAYEEMNIILEDQVISGTVYIIRGTCSKIVSVTDEDMTRFKSVARFIEFN